MDVSGREGTKVKSTHARQSKMLCPKQHLTLTCVKRLLLAIGLGVYQQIDMEQRQAMETRY